MDRAKVEQTCAELPQLDCRQVRVVCQLLFDICAAISCEDNYLSHQRDSLNQQSELFNAVESDKQGEGADHTYPINMEQELLRRVRVGDRSGARAILNELLGHIRPGITELELRAELEYIMLKQGAHGVSFDTIIASGANGSLCHAVPGEKKLAAGEFITMDFGASYCGYAADMTRTVAIGSVTEEMRRVYDVVLEAQELALEAIGEGKRCCDMDAIARGHIEAAGYGEYFGHSLGHATGLQIHEGPGCNWRDETVLAPGMSMTVEPGIYLPGRFGVRIEDLVIIEQGGMSNLALEAPKKLIIL